jgi:hypothetical protein
VTYNPAQNEAAMQRAMHEELGSDVVEVRTIVRPTFLDSAAKSAAPTP